MDDYWESGVGSSRSLNTEHANGPYFILSKMYGQFCVIVYSYRLHLNLFLIADFLYVYTIIAASGHIYFKYYKKQILVRLI